MLFDRVLFVEESRKMPNFMFEAVLFIRVLLLEDIRVIPKQKTWFETVLFKMMLPWEEER